MKVNFYVTERWSMWNSHQQPQGQREQQTTALLFLMAKNYKPRGLDWVGKRKAKAQANIKINKNKLAGKCLVCGNMLPTSPASPQQLKSWPCVAICLSQPFPFCELPLSYFIISPSHDKKFLAKQLKRPAIGVRLASQPHAVHVRSQNRSRDKARELLSTMEYPTLRLK